MDNCIIFKKGKQTMELDELIKELKVELAWIEKLKKGGGLPNVVIDYILGVGGSLLPVNPLLNVAGRISLGMVLKDVNRKSKEEYDFLYNQIFINKIGLTRITEILIDLNSMGLSERTPNLRQRLQEYIVKSNINLRTLIRWRKNSLYTLKYLKEMRKFGRRQDASLSNNLKRLDKIEEYVNLWAGNLTFVAAQIISQQNKKKGKNAGASPDNTEGTGSGFMDFSSFFPKDIYTSPLPFDSDILSFVDNMLHPFNPLSDKDFLSPLPDDLLGSSIPDYYNQFTLGDVPRIPIQYNISISGMDQVESASEMVSQTTEAMNFNDQAMNDYTSGLSEQFKTLSEEEKAIYSVSTALSSLNGTYLGGVSSQIMTIADESNSFSETLTDISKIEFEIGGAFMGVNEEIGKAVMSVGTLTEGVSGIFKAFEGEEVNGLGLMQGIGGGFAGLQGLFGGEAGSDTSQRLGGMGGMGAGIVELFNRRALVFLASIS
jgi:hypothetical protein